MKNNLPPSWSWVKLGDVCEFSQGIQVEIHKQSDRQLKDYVRFLRIIDFTQGKDEPRYVEDPGGKYYVKKDDLSMVRYGAVGFICRGLEGVIANNLFRIIPDKKIDKSLLFYFFKSHYFLNELKLNVKGATMPAISFSFIKGLVFPLPPRSEQKKIVEKIEELFSGLDSGVDSLKKAKEQIRLYRQSVLAAAFSGKLTTKDTQNTKNLRDLSELSGYLPDGWKWKTLKEITSVLGDGLHGTPKYSEDGDYYFINGNNLSDGRIEIKASTKRITSEEYEKYKKSLNDRTIFVSINGTLGKTAFYNNEKVILGKSACYFNLVEDINKKYIRYYLTSEQFIRYANRTATGSTIKNVSLKAMREFEFPLPSKLQEQTQIVEEIEKRFSEADNLEKAIDDSLAKSETLRQSILKRAFEGRLV